MPVYNIMGPKCQCTLIKRPVTIFSVVSRSMASIIECLLRNIAAICVVVALDTAALSIMLSNVHTHTTVSH